MDLPAYNFAESDFPTYWKMPEECAGRILVGGLFPESYFLIDFTDEKSSQVTINSEKRQRQMASFIESVLNQRQLPYGVKKISKFPLNFIHPHEKSRSKDLSSISSFRFKVLVCFRKVL